MRVFSKLDLDGDTPLRARPRLGSWGPLRVPTTRAKRWQRVLVPIVAVGLAVGLFFLARLFYLMIT